MTESCCAKIWRGVAAGSCLVVLACGGSTTTGTGLSSQVGPFHIVESSGATKSYQIVYSGATNAGSAVNAFVLGYSQTVTNNTLTESLDFVNAPPAAKPVAPQQLTSAASLASVQMSPTVDAVAFIDNIDTNGLGNVRFSLLTQENPMTKGVKVEVAPTLTVPFSTTSPSLDVMQSPVAYFGPAGTMSLIYIINYQTQTGFSSDVVWWNTTSMLAQPVGTNSPINGITMSADHSSAIVVTNYVPPGVGVMGGSLGDLNYVDMTTGMVTSIATNVVIQAGAYSGYYSTVLAGGGSCIDNAYSDQEPAFSVTPDGTTVVYTTQTADTNTFSVFRWKLGMTMPTALVTSAAAPGVGVFPGVSPSGEEVAWWDFSNNTNNVSADQVQLHVWSTQAPGCSGGCDVYTALVNTTAFKGTTPTNSPSVSCPMLAPIFSPDDGYVAYFTDFIYDGQGVYGGEIVNAYLLPATGIPTEYLSEAVEYTLHLGDDVAYHSFTFGPQRALDITGQTPELTTLVTFMSDCKDQTGTPNLDGLCNLFAVDTHSYPATGYGSGNQLQALISPGQSAILPTANGIAFLGPATEAGATVNCAASTGNTCHPYVFVSGMSAPRDLESANASFKYDSQVAFQVLPITGDIATGLGAVGDGLLYLTNSGTTFAGSGNAAAEIEGAIHAVEITRGGESVGDAVPVLSPQENNSFFSAGWTNDGRPWGVIDATASKVTFADGGMGFQAIGTTVDDMPLP